MARLPQRRVRGAGGVRRCAARPQGKLARPARLPAARPAARRARRPRGRSGSAIPTTWRAAPRSVEPRFKRLKLKLGGARRPRRRARARGARRRPTLPLQVDVNEAWALDEALDALRAARAVRRAVLRAAAPRGRCPASAGAEARVADSDLRRRGLPHARRRRGVRASARTGSTSSSRSPAASARRCAWCMRRARSGSAACSAA